MGPPPAPRRGPRRLFGLRQGRLVPAVEPWFTSREGLKRQAERIAPAELWTLLLGFGLAILAQRGADWLQAGRERRRRRQQLREAAAAEAAASMSAQRSRFHRALGADVGLEAAEHGEEVDIGPGLRYDSGVAAAVAAGRGGGGSAGAGGLEPWEGYMASPALDEDAQREWRAFVEKSKAAAVSLDQWWDVDDVVDAPAPQAADPLWKITEDLLARDPESQKRLERINDAAALVASLQARQLEIDRQIAEAQLSERDNWLLEKEQAQRAAERGAEADTLAAAAAVKAAEVEVLLARAAADAASAELAQTEALAAERAQSGRAGTAAALGGAAGSLPLVVAAGDDVVTAALALGTVAVSCALFGVVYRYAVRGEASDLQLKAGVVAAFGLVRGLAQAELLLAGAPGGLSVDVAARGALAAGESMLAFGFAAVALEAALQRGLVLPFGATSQEE
ncbi:hypothetical protein WJX81_005080 [Elliptochloris bilobata]|uniref:Uncharacterized protein n=1 Tax=Elliptochloris bilobata TaxID=381761 RepID=A0AAW1R229_9CHLO